MRTGGLRARGCPGCRIFLRQPLLRTPRRGPSPERPLPASRPSQGSASSSRPRESGGATGSRAVHVSSLRGRGGGGDTPAGSVRRLILAAGPAGSLRRPPHVAQALCPRRLRAPAGQGDLSLGLHRRWCQQVSSCLSRPLCDVFACVEREKGQCPERSSATCFSLCVNHRALSKMLPCSLALTENHPSSLPSLLAAFALPMAGCPWLLEGLSHPPCWKNNTFFQKK